MDKIRIRDDKLMKNVRRFRAIRTIFLILAIMVFLGIVFGNLFYDGPNEIGKEVGSGITGFIILALITYCCHLRIQHIESIRYYRHDKDQT